MSFLYETHMHTSLGSACGRSTGAEMARALAERGYAGCVVTDHFFNGNCAVDRSLPWAERCSRFNLGYYDCLEAGRRLGLDVFYGFEWNFHGAEFLVYGLAPDWIAAHEGCDQYGVETLAAAVRADGGFLIHAHPFRQAGYISRTLLFPKWADAVEARNGNAAHTANGLFDEQAARYAAQFGYPVTSGTDVHSTDGVVGHGLVFGHGLSDVRDMIACIKRGNCALV